MSNERNQDVLLRVEHLCQYFGKVKAVDDVSFDVKRGEVFGLVGESGCGKTTTGRSIINIYDITSGKIYFKGELIGAGIGSYKWAIKDARKQLRSKDLTEEQRQKLLKTIEENKAEIQKVKEWKKTHDKEYQVRRVKELEEEMERNSRTAAMAAEVPMIQFPEEDEKYHASRKYGYA